MSSPDYMKYWRVIRYWVKATYGLTEAELDILFFLKTEPYFNKDKFNKLAPELQAILEYSAEAANTANYGFAMDSYSKDLQGLIHEDKVNVHRTPEAVMKAQLASWDEVLKKLEGDAFFAKVVKSQKDWSHRVAFYDLMNAADYKLAFKHYFPGEIKF